MEIERKWMVSGWPDSDRPIIKEFKMRQGYISVTPDVTVRIREEIEKNGLTQYILCFKSRGRLARKEIEIEISKEHFSELEDLIGLPLISKLRRTYLLGDGRELEVNHVDTGAPSEFWYAEVEYDSEDDAKKWDPSTVNLENYLNDDVTEQPGQSMAEYWVATRLKNTK